MDFFKLKNSIQIYFYLDSWCIAGSKDLIESGSDPDPDPKHWLWIHIFYRIFGSGSSTLTIYRSGSRRANNIRIQLDPDLNAGLFVTWKKCIKFFWIFPVLIFLNIFFANEETPSKEMKTWVKSQKKFKQVHKKIYGSRFRRANNIRIQLDPTTLDFILYLSLFVDSLALLDLDPHSQCRYVSISERAFYWAILLATDTFVPFYSCRFLRNSIEWKSDTTLMEGIVLCWMSWHCFFSQ